jgi:hypothetical protein
MPGHDVERDATASIIPEGFAAFALVEANGFAAADVEKFENQARRDYSACRAAALHGFGFALWRIFPGIHLHHDNPPCERIKIRFDPSLVAKAKFGVSLCYDGAHSFELTLLFMLEAVAPEPARRRRRSHSGSL